METATILNAKQIEVLNAIMKAESFTERGDVVWVSEIDPAITKSKLWGKMVGEGYIEMTLDPERNESFCEITPAAFELFDESIEQHGEIEVFPIIDEEPKPIVPVLERKEEKLNGIKTKRKASMKISKVGNIKVGILTFESKDTNTHTSSLLGGLKGQQSGDGVDPFNPYNISKSKLAKVHTLSYQELSKLVGKDFLGKSKVQLIAMLRGEK